MLRPSKETTSSLVPFLLLPLPILVVRRAKKFGGKFRPRDCALSFARAKGESRGESNRSREGKRGRKLGTGESIRNYWSIVEKNLSSFTPLASVSRPPKNWGETRVAPCRAHSGLCVVIERFKEARPTQSWTKVGTRRGGEEREESKKRARWKT